MGPGSAGPHPTNAGAAADCSGSSEGDTNESDGRRDSYWSGQARWAAPWRGLARGRACAVGADNPRAQSLRGDRFARGFPRHHAEPRPNRSPPDALVLAVKPQSLDAAAPKIAPLISRQTLVLSILAGKTIANLKARLPEARAVVRAMPNTPAAIGRGVTAAFASPEVNARSSGAGASVSSAWSAHSIGSTTRPRSTL